MTEMIVVISGIGILAGIVLPQMGNLLTGSRDVVARDKLEMLNQAVKNHQHASPDNLENLLPTANDPRDEQRIVRQLQFRPDNKTSVGAPYVATNYRPSVSSSAEDYRMEWTGTAFKLLVPGQTGAGIKVVFDGSDIGAHVTFPPSYKWSGR
jgi:type II secretory pathway pseudopilin PulG